jgi:hypothetical protein
MQNKADVIFALLGNEKGLKEPGISGLELTRCPKWISFLLAYATIASYIVDGVQYLAVEHLNIRPNIAISTLYFPIVFAGFLTCWRRMLDISLFPAMLLAILAAFSLFWTDEVFWFGMAKVFGFLVCISLAAILASYQNSIEIVYKSAIPVTILMALAWSTVLRSGSVTDNLTFRLPPSFAVLGALAGYLHSRVSKQDRFRPFDFVFLAAAFYLLYRSYIRAMILSGVLMLIAGAWRRRNINARAIRIALFLALIPVAVAVYRINPLDVDQANREDVLGRFSSARVDNLSMRLELWDRILKSTNDVGWPPIYGVGIGDVDSEIWNRTYLVVGPQDSSGIKKSHSHNTFVEIYFGMGIPGALVLIWLLGEHLWVLIRARRAELLGIYIGYYLVAMANVPICDSRGGYLFSAVLLAAFAIEARKIHMSTHVENHHH